MSNDEKIEPGNGGDGPSPDQTASPAPSSLGADQRGSGGAEHRSAGGSAEGELVNVPGGDDETIRTLEHRQVPDGSGNDADDPDRRPDEDEDRYDAG